MGGLFVVEGSAATDGAATPFLGQRLARPTGRAPVAERDFPGIAVEAQEAAFGAMMESMTGGWTGSFEQLDAFLAEGA